MSFVKTTVHVDGLENVKARLNQAATQAEHAVAVQAAKDTSPFVPASTSLSLDKRTLVEENLIIYPGPYARFLYFGKLMVDPDTGSPFAKKDATKVLTDKNLVFSKAVHAQAQSHWFEASKAQNVEKWERVAAKAVAHEFSK